MAVASLLAVWFALGTSACDGGIPVLSERNEVAGRTLQEQQEWAVAQVEAVISVTGTEGLWRGRGETGPRWDEAQLRILDRSRHVSCSSEPGKVNPAGLLVRVRTDPLDEDPYRLAERVREYWATEGWTVSDVYGVEDSAAADSALIRADREDGAMLALSASDAGGGRLLFLDVQAECSNDPTVAW
ncbi:hypothetical protein ACFPZL_05645 [Leucobacter soli]|nr:hypothetical protein [Leucobacter soli]